MWWLIVVEEFIGTGLLLPVALLVAGAFALLVRPIWGRLETVPHELAHAAVAKLLGYHVRILRFGDGKVAAFGEHLGLAWTFGWGDGGLMVAHTTWETQRGRFVLVAAAGPLVDMSLLAVFSALGFGGLATMYALAASAPWFTALLVLPVGFAAGLAIAQLVVTLPSAIPWTFDGVPNDGMQVWRFLFPPTRERRATDHAANKALVVEASAPYATGEDIDAWPAEEATAIAANWPRLPATDIDGRVRALVDLAARPGLPRQVQAWLLDQAASVAIVDGTEAHVAEAQAICDQALALAPGSDELALTAAMLDAERGDVERAAPALRRAHAASRGAVATAYVALVEARAGRTTEAKRLFREAAADDDGLLVAVRLRRQLQA